MAATVAVSHRQSAPSCFFSCLISVGLLPSGFPSLAILLLCSLPVLTCLLDLCVSPFSEALSWFHELSTLASRIMVASRLSNQPFWLASQALGNCV